MFPCCGHPPTHCVTGGQGFVLQSTFFATHICPAGQNTPWNRHRSVDIDNIFIIMMIMMILTSTVASCCASRFM